MMNGASNNSARNVSMTGGGGSGSGTDWSGYLQAAANLTSAVNSRDAQKDANQMNKQLSREQMEFQKEQNQKSMNFAERMSSSAHQRAQADMKKAGLNPILAAGSPASSPAGVTSAGSMAKVEPEDALAKGLATTAQSVANLKNTEANTELVKEKTKTEEETRDPSIANTNAQTEMYKEQSNLAIANVSKAVHETRLSEAKTKQTQLQNKQALNDFEFWNRYPTLHALAQKGQINLQRAVTDLAGALPTGVYKKLSSKVSDLLSKEVQGYKFDKSNTNNKTVRKNWRTK